MQVESLDELEKAVSSGSVSTQPEITGAYATGGGAEGATPATVVFPGGVEELSSVTAWARERGASLVPVSSLPPHHTALAADDGRIVVDLSGWDRVIRADRRNRVALIEPGVTFGALDLELSKVGLRAMMPPAPRKGKSVLAAYLDRTPTMVPRAQWDLSDPLLCTELVMGNGEIFRTGCAAWPGTLEEQLATGQAQKNPMWPSSFDFFRLVQGARGSMGIVSWISLKCELRPVVHELMMVPSESLGPLVEVVYAVCRAKCGEECLILDRAALEGLTGVSGMPTFALLIGVAGFEYRPEQRLSYQRRGIERILQAEGARRVRSIGGTGGRRLHELLSSESDPFWKDRLGGHLDTFFLSTLDRATEFEKLIDDVCRAHSLERSSTSLYIQPQLGGRVAHFEATVAFAREQREEALTLSRNITRAAAAAGAYFSRTPDVCQEIALAGKPLLVRTIQRTKLVFDPDGVMNPAALHVKEVM